MLGWEILISDEAGNPVVNWISGLRGLEWIEEFVRTGGAIEIESGGYPNKYRIRAGLILSWLVEKRLPYLKVSRVISENSIESGEKNGPIFYDENIKLLRADTLVIVEAWDQS
jgi:hypothetical protein